MIWLAACVGIAILVGAIRWTVKAAAELSPWVGLIMAGSWAVSLSAAAVSIAIYIWAG